MTIKNIENAIIDYAWSHGYMVPDPPQDFTGKQIAVIGSGPAGLAAAAQLNKVSILICLFCFVFVFTDGIELRIIHFML